MTFLLGVSGFIDRINERLGKLANWCVLVACLISAGNAVSRYALSLSSNAWLEIQWYLFSAIFLFGASYTLKRNEHVRVDLVIANLPRRAQLWIDLLGGLFFLLPATTIIGWMAVPFVLESYRIGEMSNNAGGLLRWPVKLMLPLGFGLLTLQGISEIIKRIGALTGHHVLTPKYEIHLQ